jgi:ABC-type transport system substrate-binding protein
LIVLALFVASCSPEAPPSLSSRPSSGSPTPTIAAAPSQGRFVKMSYPADGDAPCGQDKAPDADHGPYRGNLKRIEAKDPTTAVFELCRPDVAFLSKIAAPAFAINDTAWLQSRIDPAAKTQRIVTEVNGTGPYRLERWDHGSEISLARNDSYWGTPPRNERVIVRWRDTASQRVVELQGATVDGVDQLDPAGVATVDADVGLVMEPRAGLNTVYLGFTSTFAPFDDVRVRQAIALGIDRQKLVDTFFPPGSEAAGYLAPCAIPNGCAGPGWYAYDPIQAKEILAAAGFADGFATTIHYREAARSTLPSPEAIATEIQAELKANLGIDASLVVEPEDTFVADVEAGTVKGINLMVQSGAWPDATAFLDPQFGSSAIKEFGDPMPDLVKALSDGRSTANPGARLAAYTKANTIIHDRVPLIPIAHTGSASGFRADVDGAAASPLRLERFAWMTPGDRRQLVWLTTNEPPGLYCPDEVDPVATLVCAQLTDSLYAYDPDGASVEPALARTCSPDKDLTTWTCKLRTGVKFHDGATLDADDVVMSFAVQWDADNPLHLGQDGDFAHIATWLGGLLHPPAAAP